MLRIMPSTRGPAASTRGAGANPVAADQPHVWAEDGGELGDESRAGVAQFAGHEHHGGVGGEDAPGERPVVVSRGRDVGGPDHADAQPAGGRAERAGERDPVGRAVVEHEGAAQAQALGDHGVRGALDVVGQGPGGGAAALAGGNLALRLARRVVVGRAPREADIGVGAADVGERTVRARSRMGEDGGGGGAPGQAVR